MTGDRMRRAVDGEIARRYRLFKEAGARDANEYEEMRLAGRDLEPVPILLVIIDEYLELFQHHPEWVELVIHIGQEGRGCNVFFTLGGQRLDLSSLSKAKSNIAFRVALRAETAEDSHSTRKDDSQRNGWDVGPASCPREKTEEWIGPTVLRRLRHLDRAVGESRFTPTPNRVVALTP